MKNKRPTISTGTGDLGTTALLFGGNNKVNKTDVQVIASGDCDELNAAIGLAKAFSTNEQRKATLEAIQNDLICLMADISCHPEHRKSLQDTMMIQTARIEWLEGLGVQLEQTAKPIKGWALPGHNPESAALDMARTVARRTERSMLNIPVGKRPTKNAGVYLNRLSDVLWLLARSAE